MVTRNLSKSLSKLFEASFFLFLMWKQLADMEDSRNYSESEAGHRQGGGKTGLIYESRCVLSYLHLLGACFVPSSMLVLTALV